MHEIMDGPRNATVVDSRSKFATRLRFLEKNMVFDGVSSFLRNNSVIFMNRDFRGKLVSVIF